VPSLWRFNHKAVLVLLGESANGADNFVDQRPKLHGLGQNSNFSPSILERSSNWLMRPNRDELRLYVRLPYPARLVGWAHMNANESSQLLSGAMAVTDRCTRLTQ
jgi:hypothetical protein